MIMMMLLVMMMMMMNNQKETELLCHQSAVYSNSVHLMSQKRQDCQKDCNACEDYTTCNHFLNKQMLIKAKMATHQYIILPEKCQKMLSLIEDGPIHPLHLKNFLKQFYPNS